MSFRQKSNAREARCHFLDVTHGFQVAARANRKRAQATLLLEEDAHVVRDRRHSCKAVPILLRFGGEAEGCAKQIEVLALLHKEG